MASEARPPAPRAARGLALALFVVAFALYARTASFGFVEYDDPSYVRDNAHITHGLTGESLRWAFTSAGYAYNWHPLTWLSHALDVQLFGLDAGAHHLVNAFLHALGAALLFLALLELTARRWPSALVAALFAVHPLRVESVAWIAERKDVLSGVFFALTLLAYGRYARAPSLGRYACVALALAAGLACKPTLVTVPCLLLLLDVWPLRRFELRSARARLWLEKLPLIALSVSACVLTLVAQREGGALDGVIALPARLANAVLAYVTYLGQYLWPFDLAVFYPHPALVTPERSRLGPALLATLLLVLLAGLAYRQRRARPWLLVGLCWFLGLLVPMIGLVQVGAMGHADRYAYLALLGVEVALAWSAAELVERRPEWRAAVAGCALVVVGALAARSVDQLGVWRSSEELFGHTLAVTEKNYVAHNNLGLALGNAHQLGPALEHFERACAIRPGFYQGELNVGKARYQQNELALARAAFERAIAAAPRAGEPHLCLGFVLQKQGEHEQAARELERALALDPELGSDPRTRELRQRLDPERAAH